MLPPSPITTKRPTVVTNAAADAKKATTKKPGKGKGKGKSATTTPNTPAAPTVTPGAVYDWGDGKGRAHSISLKTHKANVDAKALLPYDLGDGTDPAQVRNTVNSAADIEYGQPIKTQQGQITDSLHRTNTDIPAWYQQYIDAIGKARSQTADLYAAAAGSSGASVAPATGDQVGDLAAANRTAMQNSFQGLVKSQGANTGADLINQGTNAYLLQAGSLGDEARNRQTLTDHLGQLQKEKGEYGNTYLQKLKDSAATHEADMAAADAAKAAAGAKLDFDGNGVADTVDAANARYKSQATLADNKPTRWGYTVGEWRNMKEQDRKRIMAAQAKPKSEKENTKDYFGHTWEGNGGDDKGWKNMSYSERRKAMQQAAKAKHVGGGGSNDPTPTAKRSALNSWNASLDYLRQPGNVGGKGEAFVSDIQKDAGAPYDIANIAYYWAHHKGTVTSEMANQMHKLGVKISPDHIRG